MLNEKAMIVLATVGVIKKTVQMSEYFPQPKSLEGRMMVESELPNYATKAGLKNAIFVDMSKLAKKVDLAYLKSNVDKLNINKLKNVRTNLSNLKSKLDKLDVDKLLILLLMLK